VRFKAGLEKAKISGYAEGENSNY